MGLSDKTDIAKGRVYKVAILGGGPAGLGVVVRAARIGVLDELTNRNEGATYGIALVHGGTEDSLGKGKLGEYLINSNTFAKSLVASILDDKVDVEPMEKASGTYLESLKSHPSTIALNDIGHATAPLTSLGNFLGAVGQATREELKKRDTCQVLMNTMATKLRMLDNGMVEISTAGKDGVLQTLVAEKVVLATGGSQTVPKLGPKSMQQKIFLSDNVLRQGGLDALVSHLKLKGSSKVCVVGGSHSAFSVSWTLLNKVEKKGEKFQFDSKDITMLHRSPIRCFYQTQKEAMNDGVQVSATDKSGAVNTFTGLREDAKMLFKNIRRNVENRVRLIQIKDGGSGSIQQKAFEEAAAIVWCCGYETNSIHVEDQVGNSVPLTNHRGQAKIDTQARIVSGKNSLNQLLGIGLGYAIDAPTKEMNMETRADGVTVYGRRGATLVLASILGNSVFGEGNSTYDEMLGKQESKRKDAARPKPVNVAEKQQELINRLCVVSVAPPSVVKPEPTPPTLPRRKSKNLEKIVHKAKDSHIVRLEKSRQENEVKYSCPYCSCSKALGPNCKANKAKKDLPVLATTSNRKRSTNKTVVVKVMESILATISPKSENLPSIKSKSSLGSAIERKRRIRSSTGKVISSGNQTKSFKRSTSESSLSQGIAVKITSLSMDILPPSIQVH